MLIIQAIGRVCRPEDIGEVVVALRNGQPVLVRHVGAVGVGMGVVRGTGSHNGKPAVVFAIQKQPGAAGQLPPVNAHPASQPA